MQAIDTFYNGNYYRSRLEARWAYFFDLLQVPYLYEPEGFKNGNERYLPDFYLNATHLRDNKQDIGVYLEIKHENYHYDIDQCKFNWFDRNLILFPGIPLHHIWGNDCKNDGGYEIYPGWDNMMKFWICEKCNTTKIEFWEGNYNECPKCKCFGKCDDELLNFCAWEAVRVRFEHNNLIS